jgi:RNA polymerase sigma factor (sigma-70 family)
LTQLTQLIKSSIAGDRISQGKLYERFAPQMFTVCLRYSKNREEAEDLVQEGFIRIFRSLQQYRSEGSFEGWIRKIMVNCALQKYRTRSHLHAVVDIEDAHFELTDTDNIIAQLGAKELLKMVQSLPPAYQMVFNLHVFEGMKHKEIAAMLGIAEGTSKSNLSGARAILQKAVTKSTLVAKQNLNYL